MLEWVREMDERMIVDEIEKIRERNKRYQNEIEKMQKSVVRSKEKIKELEYRII